MDERKQAACIGSVSLGIRYPWVISDGRMSDDEIDSNLSYCMLINQDNLPKEKQNFFHSLSRHT